MDKRYRYLIIGLVVVCVAVIAIAAITCSRSGNDLPVPPTHTPTPTSLPAPTVSVPQTPVNLIAKAGSGKTVTLNWLDNSLNEDGFILYRDSMEIIRTGPNASTYQDSGLKPATTYQYSVKAFNKAGESGTSTFIIKTPNPSLVIKLDRIGVYDNREDITRGKDGEVYVYVAVSDGKNPVQQLRFPQAKDQEYKLAKNETVDIGSQIFYTSEVSDHLTLTVIGYEQDGEGFEPLVYKALSLVIEAQAGGMVGTITELFDIKLNDIIGDFFGKKDDSLGKFEKTWDVTTNWGTGQYTDIVCKDERGIDCLRLWFTVTSD
jgi:hypothetical protein